MCSPGMREEDDAGMAAGFHCLNPTKEKGHCITLVI